MVFAERHTRNAIKTCEFLEEFPGRPFFAFVVPAKAGTQFLGWIPAFAGMTFPGPLSKTSYNFEPLSPWAPMV